MFLIDSVFLKYHSHLFVTLLGRLKWLVESLCYSYYSDVDYCPHFLMLWTKTNDGYFRLEDDVERRNEWMIDDVQWNDDLCMQLKNTLLFLGIEFTTTIGTMHRMISSILTTVDVWSV